MACSAVGQVSSERMKRLGEARQQAARLEEQASVSVAEAARAQKAEADAQAEAASAKQEAETNLNEMWSQKNRAQRAESELAALQESEALARQAESKAAAVKEQLESSIKRLRDELERSKSDRERGEAEAAGSAEHLAKQLQQEKDRRTAERARLQEEVRAQVAAARLIRLQVARAQAVLLQYKQQLNTAEAEALAAEERAEQEEERASKLQEQIASAEQRAKQAEERTTQGVEKMKQFQEQIAQQQQQLAAQQLEISSLRRHGADEDATRDAALAALKEQLEKASSNEIAAMQEQERLQRELGEKTAQWLQCQQQVNQAEADALAAEEQAAESQSENEELAKAIRLLKAQNGSAGGQSGEVDDLKTERAELQARIDELQGKAEELQGRTDGLEKDLAASQAKVAELSQKLDPSAELKVAQKKLGSALDKLQKAQEASEGLLTCMGCMEIFKEPMTYHPCGHTFCKSCCEANKITYGMHQCEECGATQPVESLSENSLVDELCGKFTYQRQVIDGLLALKFT